jgi:hypothetical protein
MAHWDAAEATSLLASGVDPSRTQKAFARWALEHGTCVVEQGVRRIDSGALRDSRPRAVFTLRCDDAPLILSFLMDAASGQVSEIDGHPPHAPDATCWP